MKKQIFKILMLLVIMATSCSQKQFSFRKTEKAGKERILSEKNYVSVQPEVKDKTSDQDISAAIALPEQESVSMQMPVPAAEDGGKRPDKLTGSDKPGQKEPLTNNSVVISDEGKTITPDESDSSGKGDEGMDGMAIAGFVCGAVGLIIFGIILGILAIIFSAIGMKRTFGDGKGGKGFAIAGLILGILDVVFVLAFLATL